MIEKFVKCRTEHTCESCHNRILKGDEALFLSLKAPKMEDIDDFQEKQIGIQYIKMYFCKECNKDYPIQRDQYNFDEGT